MHRVEDWGRRQLAYMIQKLAKAHYLCINIECDNKVLNELETGFRFNDAVLRHLTVVKSQAETTPSVMMKTVDREESRRAPPGSVGLTNRLALTAAIVERAALCVHPGRLACARPQPEARIGVAPARQPAQGLASRSAPAPSAASPNRCSPPSSASSMASKASSAPSATVAASSFTSSPSN